MDYGEKIKPWENMMNHIKKKTKPVSFTKYKLYKHYKTANSFLFSALSSWPQNASGPLPGGCDSLWHQAGWR